MSLSSNYTVEAIIEIQPEPIIPWGPGNFYYDRRANESSDDDSSDEE